MTTPNYVVDTRCSLKTRILGKSEMWNAVCGKWDCSFITIVDVTWMYLYFDLLFLSSLTSLHWCFIFGVWLILCKRWKFRFKAQELGVLNFSSIPNFPVDGLRFSSYYDKNHYIYLANLLISEKVLNVSTSEFYSYSWNAFCVIKSIFCIIFNIFVKYVWFF